jgi:hypothetical protein
MSFGGEVRFGVRRGNLRSGTYKVVGSTTSDDVYIMSRHVGTQFKVSLHESGSWRVSVEPIDPATGETMAPVGGATWGRPAPFGPGLTKVFAVLIGRDAVGTPLTPDVAEHVRLYEVPPGAKAVQFTVIYADPGMPVTTWPGANAMQTTLVGTFTLPTSRETVYVVAHALDALPAVNPPNGPGGVVPGFAGEDLMQRAEAGTLRGILLGSDDDGMWWFMDGRVVPGDAA